MTHQLVALAALASLNQARNWLDNAPTVEAQPGLQRATPARDLTTRTATHINGLLRAERAERVTDLVTPAGAHATPIRPALIDAAHLADRALIDCAWIVSSALRLRPLLVYGPAWIVVYEAVWPAACHQLRAALPWADDQVAAEAAGILDHADRTVRLTIGVGPAWVALPGRACPTCRRRTIEAETTAADAREWILRCTNGCLVERVEDHGREHGRLGDLYALIRSVRRQGQKLARKAAA